MWQYWNTIHDDFPGNISSQFQLGRSKCSYVVSEGLNPCIIDETVKDVKNCGTGYTTIIDETTTNQNIKQLDNLFPNNLPECFLEGLQVLTFH